MASQERPEIILYDLACKKDVCFSNMVWRIRLMLNYKRIPYQTIFLEFQDIEPTLKPLGIPPHPATSDVPYTVPAIHVPSTGKYLMDSVPISEYLEATYPDPPIPLTSEVSKQIRQMTLPPINDLFDASLVGRVINILRPETQKYFRRTREERLGRTLEDLFADPQEEEEAWKSADQDLRSASDFIMKARGDGPFALGKQVSYVDFFLAGFLEFSRVVDERVFNRFCEYSGFREIYEACRPFMQKVD